MRRRVPRRPAKSASPRIRPAHRRAVRGEEDRAPDALRIFDISRPINEKTRAWAGDVPFRWRSTASLRRGSLWESTCFTMSAHLGTHADAPSHLVSGGAPVGKLRLEPFVGPARVVALQGRGEIGPDALPGRSLGAQRVLFRTEGRAFLAPLAAIRLAEKGALLVGTDALSIDPEDALDLPAHLALLSRGVMLLEGLDLSGVPDGDYELVAVPLRFEELDASPVRAILFRRGA